METSTRHRNPLFQEDLGVAPHTTLTIDVLHCQYLGNLKSYAKHIVWFLVLEGAFGRVGAQEDQVQYAILALARELDTWYKTRHKADVLEKLTRIKQFSKRIIGEPSQRKLATKGAETWGFVLFLIDVMKARRSALPSVVNRYIEAGESIVRLMTIFDEAGVNLKPFEIQECYDVWKRYCSLTADLPDLLQPKRHLVLHILEHLPQKGNPKYYATWMDEALNRTLKAACRQLSQSSFEATILCHMWTILLDKPDSKRKRRDSD